MFGMFSHADIDGIERAIHMAIAPAFLLTGIIAMLNVLTQRIGRMLDRDRELRDGLLPALRGERVRLARRARYANRAAVCCVIAASLLCAVIIISFIGVVLQLLAALVVAGLLVSAMVILFFAMLLFLAEVRLAYADLPLSAPPDGS